ncbi:hypothetical protein [Dickeya chrysanthemi]|uniref:hypothetical protein n=1 Tax=Dickeya chrysanthemi TaxID=556 RepID=UPI00301923C0
MEQQYLYLIVISLFSVIQSIFGMGLLVFGTPTLLLLGYDFSSVLGLLLPASVLISFTQVLSARSLPFSRAEKNNMVICGIAVLISLSLVLSVGFKLNIDLIVGLLLLFSAITRLSPAFRTTISNQLVKNQQKYIILMGLVHGLTNMGGAVLALYASSTQTEKTSVRSTVSRYYLLFGLIQLSTLALLRPAALSVEGFIAAPVALFIYWAVGNLLFRRASAPLYERLLTGFIAIYGLVVLTKGYI